MSNVLKRFVVAAVVGSLLLVGSAKAAPDYTVTCKPWAGGAGLPCPGLFLDVVGGVNTLFGEALVFDDVIVNSTLNGNLINAADVQTAHIGSPNGDFTNLQVGNVITLNIANVNQLNTGGLSVSGNATISGGLDVAQWVTGNAGQFGSLSLLSGGVLGFWDNGYASVGATSVGLRLIGNQILEMKWDGKGACRVRKSLPNGTATEWSWLGDDGLPKSTTTLAGVPTSCLSTP